VDSASIAAGVQDDLRLLVRLGKHLDQRPPGLGGRSLREFLIAELLLIRDRRGRLLHLHPNRAQQEFERAGAPSKPGFGLGGDGRRHIVLKARQLGVTTWVAARFFISTITRPGTLSVQVAHDQASAEEIFRIVHRFLAYLPGRLRAGALRTSRSNVRQLVFPLLDSEYRVETAADPQAGRGLTIRNLHCSEVAGWPRDPAATLASLRAAVPPDGEIVLESTPYGAGGCFYDEWQRAPLTGYVAHFFPWWLEESYVSEPCHPEERSDEGPAFTGDRRLATGDFAPEELELMRRHGLRPAQIYFRRGIHADFRGLARQEYAEDPQSCFLASGECIFELDAIEARLKDCPPPIAARDNGRLLVWLPPRAEAEYIIGVDPAGGGADGDFACAQVIERRTGCQCAELRGHLPPQELAAQVAALAHEYNQALVAVERNNHGHGVLAYLAAAEKYENVYEQNGQAGWLTSTVTRARMISELAALLATEPALFSSPRLLEECRTFVRRLDGSAAAIAGAHDDCVLAMAIAQAVRAELLPRSAASVRLATLDRGMAIGN
jgi:hypothetical protein